METSRPTPPPIKNIPVPPASNIQGHPYRRPPMAPQQSISLKVLVIVGISLLLLIPDMIIYALTDERQSRQEDTTQEISSSWSGPQLISGPIISIPYAIKGEDGQEATTGEIHILPSSQNATADIDSQTLSRSIYETTVYNADIKLHGSFNMQIANTLGIAPSAFQLDKAYITIGIGDLKGIETISSLKFGNAEYTLNGTTNTIVYVNQTPDNDTEYIYTSSHKLSYDDNDGQSGCMQAPLHISSIPDSIISYSLTMKLKGSESLGVTPIGGENLITINGVCKSPSFVGMFIPSERTVDKDTFSAEWILNSNNRSYPQVFTEDRACPIARSGVAVNMLVPVDQYHKTSRAIKYAIIVILLTFISVLFAEIMTRHPINMFQYLLIGLALILFYSLLLSLSEHIGFGASYLIASVMTIGLVGIYMLGIIKSRKIAITIAALLSVIYLFIYILLCLETFALLTGSIGLFIALAAIMYASLRIKPRDNTTPLI